MNSIAPENTSLGKYNIRLFPKHYIHELLTSRTHLQVATLVQADWLFLLTDVAHLYTANPNIDPTAQPIFEVLDIGDLQVRPVFNLLQKYLMLFVTP